MKKPAKEKKGDIKTEITINLWEQHTITVWLVGKTPLICNRQSEKTKRELLFPKAPSNKADRASRLKHDPLREYQESIYRETNDKAGTLLMIKGGAVKSAACDSAVDTPGCQAAPMRRLISVPDFYLPIYGVPQMFITDVRQSGPARTPDMRTRAIIPQWVVPVTFRYTSPLITAKQVLNLCANGGITRGLGDGRVEKGALDFGQYEVVTNPADSRIKLIYKTGSRKAQLSAMAEPTFYDQETRDLYEWFKTELAARDKAGLIASSNGEVEEEMVADL